MEKAKLRKVKKGQDNENSSCLFAPTEYFFVNAISLGFEVISNDPLYFIFGTHNDRTALVQVIGL